MDRAELIKRVAVKIARPRPPKGWWDQMTKEIKSKNPSYSQDQVDSTAGSIWYGLSDSKVREIKKRHYGEAKEQS